MSELPMGMNIDALTDSMTAVVPYFAKGWQTVQRMWVEAPMPLLIGVVIGLVVAKLMRGVLIVGGVVALGLVGAHMFGMNVPGISQ